MDLALVAIPRLNIDAPPMGIASIKGLKDVLNKIKEVCILWIFKIFSPNFLS